MQCSAQEVADWFHVSVDTLDRRLHEEYKCGFAEFFARHRTKGKMAIRRNLFQLSSHNATAAIFLAKNHLGMTDKLETVHAGDEKRPIVIQGVTAETKRLLGEVLRGEGTESEAADNKDI